MQAKLSHYILAESGLKSTVLVGKTRPQGQAISLMLF